jgi:IS5 family transposase
MAKEPLIYWRFLVNLSDLGVGQQSWGGRMLGQASFSDLEYANKKRRTRRELFLAEMEAVVPWPALLGVVEPHYPRTGGRGRRPVGLAAMLRIYFLQQWFALSDRQMEDALYDLESLRRFAGFSNVTAALPDETTILNFRHLLEQHDLTRRLLAAVNGVLKAKGLLVSQGTMVDATIVHAPSSTKNAQRERDPEMHQTKKGKQWYFGMKIHIGADVDSGAVHSVSVTAANQADISELPHLLRATDRVVFGDAGYASDHYKRGARALGMVWRVQDKAKPKGSLGARLSASQKKRNRRNSRIRARVEHLFRILKRQFGYTKVRYRGLTKNTAQVMTLISLANLYALRRRLATA